MNAFLFLQNIGFGELVIILFVGLLLFGRKLPEVSRSLGRSVVEFKKGFQDVEREFHDAERLSNEAAHRAPSAAPAPVAQPLPAAGAAVTEPAPREEAPSA